MYLIPSLQAKFVSLDLLQFILDAGGVNVDQSILLTTFNMSNPKDISSFYNIAMVCCNLYVCMYVCMYVLGFKSSMYVCMYV